MTQTLLKVILPFKAHTMASNCSCCCNRSKAMAKWHNDKPQFCKWPLSEIIL